MTVAEVQAEMSRIRDLISNKKLNDTEVEDNRYLINQLVRRKLDKFGVANGIKGVIRETIDANVKFDYRKVNKKIEEVIKESFEVMDENQLRIKNFYLYKERVSQLREALDLTPHWEDKYSYVNMVNGDKKTIGYYNFGVKDNLQPIDEYIEEVKKSSKYKAYIKD